MNGTSANRTMSLVLFMLFVAAIAIMLVAGARSYAAIAGIDDDTRDHRAANGAIVNTLHALDSYDAITSRELNGNKVMVLRQNTPEGVFEHLIYLWDDSIMTEYVPAGTQQYNPFEGAKLLDSKTFDFDLEGDLVTIRTDQGETCVALHSDMPEANHE